jgi:hypothetical protein
MLAGVILVLAFWLGAVGDEVVRRAVVVASLLLTTTPTILVVVVEPLEPVDDQCQIVVTKHLNLLL